ncbi:MAG TPA: nitroreductase family protein [Dehalococcoidia bacterium]|nr:nitroreductase family protein [Dehalococcoidia bacterium]
MTVFDAVRTVLAVRRYKDEPLPAELVRRIVEAAWLTGSSRNGQPWHFIAVQDRAMLRRLGGLAQTGPYIADAALAVVVVMEESIYNVSDVSRAVQSMMLTAWDQGVGSNWVGFGNLDWANAVLGIPATLKVMAIVPFGYPVTRLGRGKKNRKPFAEIVSRERYGQPFA